MLQRTSPAPIGDQSNQNMEYIVTDNNKKPSGDTTKKPLNETVKPKPSDNSTARKQGDNKPAKPKIGSNPLSYDRKSVT